MREILIITKKEFARFFNNKFTAFAALLLPGLLMAIIYSAMGNMDGGGVDEDETFTVAVSNLPSSIESLTKDAPVTLMKMSENVPSKEAMREAINNGEYDVYAVFPVDFDSAVSGLSEDEAANAEPVPLVSFYYDSSSDKSYAAYETFSEVLNAYESSLTNLFDINAGDEVYDLADENAQWAKILSSVLPMLVLVMLITSIVTISAESIAGEKERGTIASLLATPIDRSKVVWGKLITITTIAVVSTIFTLAGIIIGLANMSHENINFSVYSMSDYALLGGVLVPFAVMISVLMIIFSALAPNIRSAQIYSTALQLGVMGLALFAGMNGSGPAPLPHYFVPFYNTAHVLVDVFACEASGLAVLITALVNIVLSVIGVFAARKILNSERFMFQR